MYFIIYDTSELCQLSFYLYFLDDMSHNVPAVYDGFLPE